MRETERNQPMSTNSIENQRFHDQLLHLLRWEDLDEEYIRQLITLAKEEDLEGAGLEAIPPSPGDVTTSAIATDETKRAQIVASEELVICGLPLVPLILDTYGTDQGFEALVEEGVPVREGAVLAEFSGSTTSIITAERVILNFLGHLSGIATNTARFVEELHWSTTKLIDNRNSVPGLRVLEKYAVAQGGGWNQRVGLFDRIVISEKHFCQSHTVATERFANAVDRARHCYPNLPVEVEVHCLDQIPAIVETGVEVIRLLNFSLCDLTEAIELIGTAAFSEASGPYCLQDISQLSNIGLDFVSCSTVINQSVRKEMNLIWCD